MQINAPFNTISAARARALLGALGIFKPRTEGLLVNNSDTPDANPVNGTPIAYGKAGAVPADLFPIAPPSGFEAGDRLRAGAVLNFKTARDKSCQEVGLHVDYHVVTGETLNAGNTAAGMSDGKSGFSVAAGGYPGGGQMWGMALTATALPGYRGKGVYGIEIDVNNNSCPRGPGQAAGPAVGIFQNSISHYKGVAAHWIIGTAGTGPGPLPGDPNGDGVVWEYGTFYQDLPNATNSRLIGGATFIDDTKSDVVLRLSGNRTHAVAGIYDSSAGPYAYFVDGLHTQAEVALTGSAPLGVDVAGAKGAYDARFRANSGVGVKIEGSKSFSAIDTTAVTGSGVAVRMNNGQTFDWDSYRCFANGDRFYVARISDGATLFSIDGNGTVRARGPILGNQTTL